MAEQVGDYEWHAEGEEAELVIYAPDGARAEGSLERLSVAASLPGARSPVYAAAVRDQFGWVAASTSHVAPDLLSAPEYGVLFVADTPVDNLGMPPREVARRIPRDLYETSPPILGTAAVREAAEADAAWAAGEGFIEEEDLSRFTDSAFAGPAGDPDALGRRAVSAGGRWWDPRSAPVGAFRVAEILDTAGAEELDLDPGSLALVTTVGSGDLGRLALATHRDRISSRGFAAPGSLPAAPMETEEAEDLLAAASAAANYAAARTALQIFLLRRALGELVGGLRIVAVWRVGGLQRREGLLVHYRNLAAVGSGEAMVAGKSVAAGMGAVFGSAPAFGVEEREGRWAWEEAGLLERRATLEPLEELPG